MPVVTKITTQKKNNERFNIYWNKGSGEEYGFSLDQDTLIRFEIKKGVTLSEEELEDILLFDTYKKGLNKAIQFLSYRMRSKQEILAYLYKNETPQNVCEKIIAKLEEYGYVDDLEFATMFVRNRMQLSSKGPEVIKQELVQKGVVNDTILRALSTYTFADQVDNAIKYAEKKLNTKKKDSVIQIKQKLSHALISKGFSWEVVQTALDSVNIEKNNEEQWEALVHHAEKLHRRYKKYDRMQFHLKMRQALYQKGFPADLINRWMDQNNG